MTTPDAIRRAAECRQFAGLARDGEMRARWLAMADEWEQRARQEPDAIAPRLALAD